MATEPGAQVLRQACAQWGQWRDAGLTLERIAVNLSGRRLAPPGLAAQVREVLEQTGCPAPRLELEVTEGFVMSEGDASLAVLEALRQLGLVLAIDDFGSGYASLSYLKRLPVSRLKIDRSFIRGLPEDPEDATIARAVIALGTSLELELIAEGVETASQAAFLVAAGCRFGQGFYFGHPVSASAFLEQWRGGIRGSS